MVSFPDKNLFVKVFKNEFFGPNQGPSLFLLGVNTWKVFSFWWGFKKSHMVENWYEYYFRLRCYVSSWGGQYLEGSFFLAGIGEIMVENWYEYNFR